MMEVVDRRRLCWARHHEAFKGTEYEWVLNVPYHIRDQAMNDALAAVKAHQAKKKENSLTENQTFGDSVQMRAISGAQEQQGVDEDVIPSVGRSATIEAEEGRANVNLHRRTHQAAGPHNEDENISENRDGNNTKKPQQASLDAIFLSQLEETERYEKDLTFRLLVWIPMLLSL